MDCSPPGSSVPGDSPGRNTEVGAMPFSKGSPQPRDQTQISGTASGLYHLSHQEAHIYGSDGADTLEYLTTFSLANGLAAIYILSSPAEPCVLSCFSHV